MPLVTNICITICTVPLSSCKMKMEKKFQPIPVHIEGKLKKKTMNERGRGVPEISTHCHRMATCSPGCLSPLPQPFSFLFLTSPLLFLSKMKKKEKSKEIPTDPVRVPGKLKKNKRKMKEEEHLRQLLTAAVTKRSTLPSCPFMLLSVDHVHFNFS